MRPRRNPDPGHRLLERQVYGGGAGPEERAGLARMRRRRGERVSPWEVEPLSYVFLDAYRDLAKHYKPGGILQKTNKSMEGRVEGQRMHRPDEALFGAPKPMRFYAVPSSFPTIGTDETPFYTTMDREDEILWHMKAIEEWRAAGAIVVRLPFDLTEHLKVHATRRGHAETLTPDGKCDYCRWMDAYQWRVLTAEKNLQSAINQSGHAGGHTVQYVLIPEDWKWARIMQRRKGRWKNNP